MIRKQDLHRLNHYLWEIPTSFHPEMKIPVWIFADEDLLNVNRVVETVSQAGIARKVARLHPVAVVKG